MALHNVKALKPLIQRRRITLTSAQILALNGSPITLVPAQGAGVVIDVTSLVAKLKYGSVAYAGANAVEIRYTNGSGAKATGDLAAAWLNGSADAYVKAVGAAVTPVANAPVVAFVPTASPTAGDSSVTFDILYRTVGA